MKKILILITAFIFASCSDNLESLNQNVKDPSSVPGESLFTGAQKNLVDQMVTPNVNLNNTKLWSQFWQETTYTDESNYDQTGRSIPRRHWSALYKDVLKDLNEASKVINNTTYLTPLENNEQKQNKLAIIEILNVYTYSILVETFGNVPYTEALNIDIPLPKYDDGLTIYKDLIDRLSVAINNLDISKPSFDDSDRIYFGNVLKWKKFGNSLKLRMGLLLSDVDNVFAQQTVEDAVADGVILSNADNALYTYLTSAPNTNPVHANLVLSGRNDYVAAKTITNMMNALTDPRRPKYFTDVSGAYVGGVVGSQSNYFTHSHVSDLVKKADFPGDIFDYSEVEFLLAEASARSYSVGGTPKDHYDNAIKASFEFWGLSLADATTYLANPSIDYTLAIASSTAATPWKEVIGNQKWLALYNRGFEAWTSIRMLDFPIMAVPTEALSGFPNRYTYPVVEQTLNGTNYQAASTAIGTDTAEQKLFWDLY